MPRILSAPFRPTRHRSSSSSSLLRIALISLLLLEPATHINAINHKPQKRLYDSHAYYVLETTVRSPSKELVSDLADALNTELVERVGELDQFWLVMAPKSFVDQGYPLHWAERALEPRSIPGAPPRDAILERFELIRRALHSNRAEDHIVRFDARLRHKRALPPPRLSPRHLAPAVRSLERQSLRKRHKRDAIYVPSPDGRSPILLRDLDQHLEKRAALPGSKSLSQLAAEKYNIKDPLWPKQWHLVNDIDPHHMLNATGVWDMGITGKNITVAIVDDGLDMTSEDLKPNFYEAGSWDYNDHTPLPEPRLPDDLHGTRCAGEIAAIKNDVCGVGVAFDAKVAGIRILSASISDADEASALNYGYQNNDIYSCSWGPPDDGKSMEAPSRLIFKAMLNGIQNGRGGKGSVFVFASGNGGAVDDQCNFDGYTNSIYSITISAIDRKGLHPYYSEVCSANMVVTYSSGSGDNIHTTDVGKNKCTDRHGGTSAAAPLGAAIFALVLEARPDLTWRDVQHLAVATATPFDLEDPEWQRTATGRYYNHKFGFGNMDAFKIVEAAKTWKLVKPQAWWTSPNVNAHSLPVTKEGANATLEVKQADLDKANFETLEHITVAVNIMHGRRGNVKVMLVSPHGTVSVLATHRRFDEATTGFPGWVFMTVKHWGESAVGNWTLSVQDPHQTPGKNGTFEDWAMGMWGECKDATKQPLFKMPDDAEIVLPPSPVSGQSLETMMPQPGAAGGAPAGVPTALPNPPPLVSEPEMGTNIKSLARPQAHLPEDHAGNYTSPDMLTGVGGLSAYLRGRSSWVFAALGTAIVAGGCMFGWFILLRMRRRRERERMQMDAGDQGVGLLSGARRAGLFQKVVGAASGRGNGFGFEPVAGEEDLPMRALAGSDGFVERVGTRIGAGRGRRAKATTKELYDAFGDGSSESSEAEASGSDERKGGPGAGAYSDIKADDEYMDSFLQDDTGTPLGSSYPPAEEEEDEDSQKRRSRRRNRGEEDESGGVERERERRSRGGGGDGGGGGGTGGSEEGGGGEDEDLVKVDSVGE